MFINNVINNFELFLRLDRSDVYCNFYSLQRRLPTALGQPGHV